MLRCATLPPIDVATEKKANPAPRLSREVHSWAKAWKDSEVGIWRDLGPTRLTFLEYLLIGVASMALPALLNREGVNR